VIERTREELQAAAAGIAARLARRIGLETPVALSHPASSARTKNRVLLPWIFRFGGEVCIVGKCFDLCLRSTLAAGAIAGALVALRAARKERHWSFCLAAISVAGFLGTLGCSVAGGAGVLGLLAGVAASSAPVLLRAQLRGG
jgi:hypothetical protein